MFRCRLFSPDAAYYYILQRYAMLDADKLRLCDITICSTLLLIKMPMLMLIFCFRRWLMPLRRCRYDAAIVTLLLRLMFSLMLLAASFFQRLR